MKFAFALLLIVHGAIHGLGFVKAFGLVDVAQLHQPISRPLGVLWLVAALGLIACAALLFVAPRYWWMLAAPTVLLSQALILGSWADARAGTLANLIALVPIALALLDLRGSSLRSTFEREVMQGLARSAATSLITEADLAPLPAPVQTWLRRVGVVGRARVHSFHAVFRAQMRSGRDAPWMDATTDQYNFYDQPARLFFMQASRFGVPFDALHRYVGPHATMQVRVAGVLEIVNARGLEMDQSETVTLFNDLCILAPAALIDAPVTWELIDSHTVRAAYTNAGHTVHADLTFDAQGDLVGFVSPDRYQSADGKTFHLYPWSTPVTEFGSFHGYRLCSRAEARWREPGGEWTYGRFDLVDVTYNVASR